MSHRIEDISAALAEVGVTATEDWAVRNTRTNTLACWQGSRHVPFLTTNRELAEATARTGDVLEALTEGDQREAVQVLLLGSEETQKVVVLDRNTMELYCILQPASG